jgi:hypothetical protein
MYPLEISPDDAAVEPYLEHLAWLMEHPLDLNTVDASDLAGLPGVSPADARLVMLWRKRVGRFSTL